MKRKKFLVVLFAVIATVTAVFGLCACSSCGSGYTITVNSSMPTMDVGNETPFVITAGDDVDFTEYFIVKDKNGMNITVTKDMLDLSKVDTSVVGSFYVTITVGGKSLKATFMVMPAGTVITPPNVDDDPSNNPEELKTIFAKYTSSLNWNFADNVVVKYEGQTSEDYYEYLGDNILNKYEYDGDEYTDYLAYDADADLFYFLYDNGDGTYTTYDENSDDFAECCSYLIIVDLSVLGNYEFTKGNGCYTAVNPSSAGNDVFGEYEGSAWTSLTVYIANGNVTKLVGVMDDGYTCQHEFSKFGAIDFTLPDGAGSGGDGPTIPEEPTGTMENQTYNESSMDKSSLQDKMLKTDEAIGLPSTGTYNALVIPVQFKGDTITTDQLAKLNSAFNGDSNDTGWQSVKTYYQNSSYGKLNLTFDIQDVYQASYNSSYYETYSKDVTLTYEDDQGETQQYTYTQDGAEAILLEALAFYDNLIDLSKYDTNGDGCIDAVYLIYSAPVDYESANFYWAYVTWYGGDQQFTDQNLDAYYYLFAGFDFMDESVEGNTLDSGYPDIAGLKINASTFIHESGHLLGLDDYYDYKTAMGYGYGLGGADMMDYTVGDHGVYSKLMLGWLEPQIVTSTTTITIESLQAKGDAILIPLNFNDSYFCEYLLIDLYSAKGLNEMHANAKDTYLYGGADFGVRIYHVSSWATDPYNNSFGSFTDYNNSTSYIPLIKLVEADGETHTSNDDGGAWAAASDLWQAGQSLNTVFPKYIRNDGKLLNFNVTVDSVSENSATITITFTA